MVRNDDGQAGGHRLVDDQAPLLVSRRMHKRASQAIPIADVAIADEARQMNLISQMKLINLRTKSRLFRTASTDDEIPWIVSLSEIISIGLKKQRDVFCAGSAG